MITHLGTSNVGPASSMSLDFGPRLNLFTGDNGLGKSFLLDIVWWAMTRHWPAELNPKLTAGKMALPTDKTRKAEIDFSFSAASKPMQTKSRFMPRLQGWTAKQGRPANPGLVFYAMADGSFAVWDPARNYWKSKGEDGNARPAAYVFSPTEVWDGLQREDGTWLCNGLIRDWAGWQKEKGTAFSYLESVLEALSSPDEEKLVPGELTRISLDDVRDMPTLKMPYGQEVAVVHASSGMRRIVSLAYFLVWCWEEHLRAKKLLGERPSNKTTFLIDEVEAHLHPKWQRSIIPALMNIMDRLMPHAEVQLILATHSPLVMSSVESVFDAKQDVWFDIDLVGDKVCLTERTFFRQGNVCNWLTSDAFDMKSGYSREAEAAIEKAKALLSCDNTGMSEARQVDVLLRNALSEIDPFWIRWRYVAEKKGWLR